MPVPEMVVAADRNPRAAYGHHSFQAQASPDADGRIVRVGKPTSNAAHFARPASSDCSSSSEWQSRVRRAYRHAAPISSPFKGLARVLGR